MIGKRAVLLNEKPMKGEEPVARRENAAVNRRILPGKEHLNGKVRVLPDRQDGSLVAFHLECVEHGRGTPIISKNLT